VSGFSRTVDWMHQRSRNRERLGPVREQPPRATPPRTVRAAGTPGCSAKRSRTTA